MKNIFNKRIVVGAMAVALAMLTNNCTNLTNGISTDPVNITDPSVIASSKYMSGIEVSLMGVFEGEQARGTGMWAGYFNGADRQYTGLGNYVTSGQDYDNIWNTIYANILEDCKLIKHNANPARNLVTVGITQVIEAMVVGLAADCWGDVPFTQAAQFPVISTPVFDKQAAVYASAHALLDSAINYNLIPTAPGNDGGGDFLLGGSKSAWLAVAHTVKARLYLHVRDYANAALHAASGIQSVGGNLMAPHGGAYLQTFNLYYSFLVYDRGGYMAANSFAPTLLDVNAPGNRNNLKTDETARLNYIYYPGGGLEFAPGSVAYEPNVLCDDFTEPQQSWPSTADGFFAATASFPLVTFQENALILAEANAKLGNTQPAIDALNVLRAYYATGAHVNPDYAANYTYKYAPYVYADFAPTTGIDNNGTDTQDQALLREILEERYLTLLGQIEGWNDMRRTGNFLKITLPAGKTDFPRRLLYSQGEVTTNGKNVPTSGVGLFDPVTSFSTAY